MTNNRHGVQVHCDGNEQSCLVFRIFISNEALKRLQKKTYGGYRNNSEMEDFLQWAIQDKLYLLESER